MFHLVAALTVGAVVFALGNRSVIGAAAGAALMAAQSYLSLPVYSPDFAEIWVMAAASIVVGGGVSALLAQRESEAGSGLAGPGLFAVALVAVLAVAYFVTSSPLLHASAYRRLLGDVGTIPFEQAIQRLDTTGRTVADRAVIDQQHVRLVDAVLARRRAQELIGGDPEFGGTFQLGEMELTRRDGRLTWAAPLDYTGFFRWLNGDGTPAYVWVDAHDPREAGVVKEAGGRPLRMRCVESAWGGQNLMRAVWSRSLHSTGLADPKFEIGPDGRPFFVVPTYDHRVGFSGEDPSGVAIMDPQTCEVTWRASADVPAWVNRVVPSEFALEQAANWGAYGRGWLNQSMFGSHIDTRIPTPGIELVSTTNGGDTAWYIGLSTWGNTGGTTGFLLVDSRTKRATYFEQAGATEEGARAAILGQVAEKRGWDSTWPILYNIQGRATYLATLKDASGNFKGVALMPVDDRNLVVVADDLRRALQAYTQAIAGRAHAVPGAAPSDTEVTLDGVVARIAHEVVGGNSVYWITVVERPGILFTATNRIGPQVALTRDGDAVRLRAQGEDGAPLTVLSLDNPAVAASRR